MIPYNPLAGGFLTGKHQVGAEPAAETRFALGGRAGEIYRQRYWQGSPVCRSRASQSILCRAQ